MWVVMSAAEREEFLAGVHVGVLSATVGTAGRTPEPISACPPELTLPPGQVVGSGWARQDVAQNRLYERPRAKDPR